LKRHAVAFTKGLEGAKKARTAILKDKNSETIADKISEWLSKTD
jgi:hypothetical protein